MSEQRTIKLNLNAVDTSVLREHGYNKSWPDQPNEFDRAIAYLSLWNLSFPVVKIYRDGPDFNLIAHYYREDGTHCYTIGAMWHDGRYGFYS